MPACCLMPLCAGCVVRYKDLPQDNRDALVQRSRSVFKGTVESRMSTQIP